MKVRLLMLYLLYSDSLRVTRACHGLGSYRYALNPVMSLFALPFDLMTELS